MGTDDKLKSDKAMQIARKKKPKLITRNLLSNKMYMYQHLAVKPTLMLSDKIKTSSVENVGITREKMSSPRHEM